MKQAWRDYGLSITLFTLFIICWLLQSIAGYIEHVQGDSVSYVWVWLASTMENWASEFLQLAAMVVLTTYLIHKNSPQSRDGSDKMQQSIDHIERLLKERQ
jgi:hypothetical protein